MAGLDAPAMECSLVPTLAAMAQKMIGKYDRHHRFADGNRADADAGIVPAFRD